jgi:hypothetical protein
VAGVFTQCMKFTNLKDTSAALAVKAFYTNICGRATLISARLASCECRSEKKNNKKDFPHNNSISLLTSCQCFKAHSSTGKK